ncbi:hypothetical protein SEA_TRACKER_30 [Gordonia phage Tracker]|nr:hypothetical protein SEA_TRACKER_30 [Gordonia phage Tracker]
MAKKLNTYVWLREPGALEQTSFAPGDTLPEWAEELLANSPHVFEGYVKPSRKSTTVKVPLPKDQPSEPADYKSTGEATGKEPAATEEGKTQLDDADSDDDDDDGPKQPKGNASREAWALFAGHDDIGVPVTPDMSRDDIKAACAEAGVLDSE